MNQKSSLPLRKLAAIMFTDIVGYSRVMSLDESKAFALLDQHDQILHAIIDENQGKVLKKMGDAFFVEFASSVNAVNCATKIQESLREFNKTRDSQDQIIIRIGMHLGDVIIHGDDLFGEGINVAARLEPLAPPGGICMSQAVYQSVSSHTELVAQNLGEIELKNIIEKYTVYTIPSFYVEHPEESPRPEPKEKTLDFTIKKIQHLPSATRSFWSMFGIMTTLFIISILVGYFYPGYSAHKLSGIKPEEITNRAELIAAFQDSSDQAASYFFNQLQVDVQKLIIEHKTASSISDSTINVIRRGMNKLIRSDNLILPNDILVSINHSQHLRDRIDAKSEEKNVYHINRLIIGSVLKDHITELPIPFLSYEVNYVLPELPGHIRKNLGFLLLFIIVIFVMGLFLAYLSALSPIRITFSRMNHIDHVLEYFTEQMGFKPPIKDKGYLVFKRTKKQIFKDIFLGNEFRSGIKARVDGNSIILITTIPSTRLLEKQFQAYSNSELE